MGFNFAALTEVKSQHEQGKEQPEDAEFLFHGMKAGSEEGLAEGMERAGCVGAPKD